jgi:hypothetical protein
LLAKLGEHYRALTHHERTLLGEKSTHRRRCAPQSHSLGQAAHLCECDADSLQIGRYGKWQILLHLAEERQTFFEQLTCRAHIAFFKR